jgi:putative transposase
MGENGDPNKVAMDKSGASKAAIDAINLGRAVQILVRQVKTSTTLSSSTIVPSSV